MFKKFLHCFEAQSKVVLCAAYIFKTFLSTNAGAGETLVVRTTQTNQRPYSEKVAGLSAHVTLPLKRVQTHC